MRRSLFTIAAVLSMLLSIATALTWVRSRSRITGFIWMGDTVHTGLVLDASGVEFTRYHLNGSSSNGLQHCVYIQAFDELSDQLVTDGMDGGTALVAYMAFYRGSGWRFPFWAMIIVELILPFAWLLSRWKRRAVVRRNGCAVCNYNLAGNESGICPECGTKVAIT